MDDVKECSLHAGVGGYRARWSRCGFRDHGYCGRYNAEYDRQSIVLLLRFFSTPLFSLYLEPPSPNYKHFFLSSKHKRRRSGEGSSTTSLSHSRSGTRWRRWRTLLWCNGGDGSGTRWRRRRTLVRVSRCCFKWQQQRLRCKRRR